MYQPRRISDAPSATTDFDGDAAAAFRVGPRRAAKSRIANLRGGVVPTALSVALLATAGVAAVNLRPAEGDTAAAVPAPVRAEDSVSRDVSRALVETAATEQAPAEETVVGAGALVAGTWSSQFGAAAGDRFAQSDVAVRAQASPDSAEVGSLKEGDKVSITDRVTDGFRQVVVNGKVGYVAESKLGAKAPVKEAPKAAAPAKAAAAAPARRAAAAAAPAAPAASAEKFEGSTSYSGKTVLGLKPKAMVVYNAVTERWSFSSIGGYRASNNRSNHGSGGAIDFMLTPGKDSAKGWAVANYVAANASAFGIDHIIFEQKIWTPYRPYWRPMENRGSVTANHYDHVHVSVKL